jgi:ankyrin repeat protein
MSGFRPTYGIFHNNKNEAGTMNHPGKKLSALILSMIAGIAGINAYAGSNAPITARGSKLETTAVNPQPADFWQAVNAGSLVHVKKFFKAGDLNAKDALEQPALMIAAGRGHGDVVAWLLQQGANVDTTGPRNWTPLIAAVFNNHAGVAKQLLARHANIEAQSADGFNPLFYAIEYHYDDMIDALLAAGANVNAAMPPAIQNGHTALMHASLRDAAGTAKKLLAKGARIEQTDAQGRTALFYAAEHDALATLEVLAQGKANLAQRDRAGDTALHVVALQGKPATAGWLVQHGINAQSTSNDGRTALAVAAFAGNTDVARLLLTKAGEQDRNGALFAALEGGSLPTLTALMDTGLDINARNRQRQTPLMVAATLRHAHILEYLLQKKADLDAVDNAGNTALLHALLVSPSHAGIVAQLLQAGSDAAHRNKAGQQAQELLAQSGDENLRALARSDPAGSHQ